MRLWVLRPQHLVILLALTVLYLRGGQLNVLVNDDLLIDVDYTFAAGSNIILNHNVIVYINDGSVSNNIAPSLTITQSTVLPCGGSWREIRIDEPSAGLIIKNSNVSGSINGIIATESTSLQITNSSFTDFSKFGFRISGLPNQVESPSNQLTFTGNSFTDIRRPLHLEYIDAPISIGQDNSFITAPPFFPPFTSDELTAITINDCRAVSIAENNYIQRYYAGIFAYGAQGTNNHLVIDGLEVNGLLANFISDSHAICTRYQFDQLTGIGAGVNLRVQNSSFQSVKETIRAWVPDGGYFHMLDNEFTNNGIYNPTLDLGIGYLAVINGNSLGSIQIHRNRTTNKAFGLGVQLNTPLWHAGRTALTIEDNDFTTDIDACLELSLLSGGIIKDNVFRSLGTDVIYSINTDRIVILDNHVTSTLGNGQGDGGIFLNNCQSCFLSCNYTQNGGAGLSFFENCDGATILRNTMNNHIRGLSVYSVDGVGLVGQQPYHENVWNGGNTAEASLESVFVPNIPFFFKIANQFTVGSNTGNLWPSPIIPTQSNNGTSTDWFHLDPNGSLPQACSEPNEEPIERMTAFDKEGIIGEGVMFPINSEGKYRDATFNLYRKLTDYPEWLDATNQSWYNSVNTTSFQSRYAVYNKQKHLEDLVELANFSTIRDELSDALVEIAQCDNGSNDNNKALRIADAQQKQDLLIEAEQVYRNALLSEIEAIQSDLENWVPEEPADDLLKQVLTIYYDNLYVPFNDYPQSDQEIIASTAGLCVTEYGEAVYLANAIANTLFEYNAIEVCSRQSALKKANVPSVAEGLNQKPLSVYPSPSKGFATVDVSVKQSASLRVYNLIGQIIESQMLAEGDQSLRLDLSTQNDGMYLIEVQLKNGERYVEKLLLQR